MDQLQADLQNLSINEKPTGLVHSAETLKHEDPKDLHPERPARVTSIVSAISQLIKDKKNVEVIDDIKPCEKELITLVHPSDYFDKIESFYEPVDGVPITKDVMWVSADCYVNKHTANASRVAVSGTVLALDKVVTNEWSNAFAAIRPPGHHAGHLNNPNGFCIYNNVAIGLAHLRRTSKVKKICVFDWDVHHGDGTEAVTYDDRDTLFISLHRYDKKQFYPGTGHPERNGGPNAKGYNVNVGWNVSEHSKTGITAGTSEYIYAFNRLLEPIIKEFQPEVIVVSSGFDSAVGDPLGRCGVTPEGYAYMTERLLAIQSKLVVVLEGGYNLQSISNSASAVFRILTGERLPFTETGYSAQQLPLKSRPNEIGIKAVEETLKHHQEFWPRLNSPELIAYQNRFQGEEGSFITGGHIEAFKIDGDKVYKQCKPNELAFYRELNDINGPFFNENMYLQGQGLIPKLLGIEGDRIIMENLFSGMPNASVIDIKLGAKTYQPGSKKRQQEIDKGLLTETTKIGLRLAGIKYKDINNQIQLNLHGTAAYTTCNNEAKVKQQLTQILKSNDAPSINQEALKDSIAFVEKVITFIEKLSKRYFRSSSLLIAVDNIVNKWVVRWIDFNYAFPLETDDEDPEAPHDRNLLFALQSIHRILKELAEEQNVI